MSFQGPTALTDGAGGVVWTFLSSPLAGKRDSCYNFSSVYVRVYVRICLDHTCTIMHGFQNN